MFKFCHSLLVWFTIAWLVRSDHSDEESHHVIRRKRYLTYTFNSAIGEHYIIRGISAENESNILVRLDYSRYSYQMFLAFAVPVEIPNRDIIFSYNFEANYNLPTDIQMYDLTPPSWRFAQALNRTYVYGALEEYINGLGSPGRQCILRMICDVAKSSLYHNGLLGHLIHLLFTPSSSQNEDLYEEEKAEKVGLDEEIDCSLKYEACPLRILDAITFL